MYGYAARLFNTFLERLNDRVEIRFVEEGHADAVAVSAVDDAVFG
jgi:hypothetical protein